MQKFQVIYIMFTYIFLMASEFWVLFIEAKLLLSYCFFKNIFEDNFLSKNNPIV